LSSVCGNTECKSCRKIGVLDTGEFTYLCLECGYEGLVPIYTICEKKEEHGRAKC